MEATTNQFKVGDGATKLMYSDRQAFTVIEVSKSGRRIKLQRDNAILLNSVTSNERDKLDFQPGGFVGHTSGVQRYKYKRNTGGTIIEASLRKTGKWIQKGCKATEVVSGRHEHYDYNF